MHRLKYVIGIVALLVLLMPSSAWAVANPGWVTIEEQNTYTSFSQKNVRISWGAVSNASGYMVEVLKAGTEKGQTWVDNGDPRVFTQKLYSSSSGDAGLWGAGTYTLRVKAKVGLDWSSGIQTGVITYKAPNPTGIRQQTLRHGDGGHPWVTWDVAVDEENHPLQLSYHVWRYKSADGVTWGPGTYLGRKTVVGFVDTGITAPAFYRYGILNANPNIGDSGLSYGLKSYYSAPPAPSWASWRIPDGEEHWNDPLFPTVVYVNIEWQNVGTTYGASTYAGQPYMYEYNIQRWKCPDGSGSHDCVAQTPVYVGTALTDTVSTGGTVYRQWQLSQSKPSSLWPVPNYLYDSEWSHYCVQTKKGNLTSAYNCNTPVFPSPFYPYWIPES